MKTQEGTENETSWDLGKTLEHHFFSYSPKTAECGPGKFHACSTPFFCDEFRSTNGDKYIAIRILIEDIYLFPNAQYPHKIAFRKGEVLYLCDKIGVPSQGSAQKEKQ
jgi:hypothetical protein